MLISPGGMPTSNNDEFSVPSRPQRTRKKCHHITPAYRFSASIITIFLGLEPCSKKFSSGL